MLKHPVIHVSKNLGIVTPESGTMFPFLKSQLFQKQSKAQLTISRIHAICNPDNIRNYIPHKNDCQQFVLFGRSNVGKSTLINKLIGMDVAQTSKRPGKTKQLAFFKLRTAKLTYFVDAPGYGYASAASKTQIGQWGKMIQYYLQNTPTDERQVVLLLMDIMHGLKTYDVMLMDMLARLKKQFILVFTKADRANQQEISAGENICTKILEKYQQNMNCYVHITSAVKNEGIDELRQHLMFKVVSEASLYPGETTDKHGKNMPSKNRKS